MSPFCSSSIAMRPLAVKTGVPAAKQKGRFGVGVGVRVGSRVGSGVGSGVVDFSLTATDWLESI